MSKVIKSINQPKQTNVTWIDTSVKPAVTKSYINGQWIIVGGGGGTKKYSDLEEKPTINGVELDGNKTSSDLGMATSQQGVKADSAYQKPQTGIPESDLSSDVQQALQKHFKGWLISTSQLPSNPVVGDYAYVEDSGTTYIYRCTTNGEWPSTSTEEKEPSDVTFAGGEEVNETYIDDTHLVNPKYGALPTAEDVMQLKAKLEGMTAEEFLVEKSTLQDYKFQIIQSVKTGYYNSEGAVIASTTNKSVKIGVSGYKSIRFLGVIRKSAPDVGQPCYCFLDANDGIVSGSLVEYDIDETLEDNTTKEYTASIPTGAASILLLWYGTGGLNTSNFYCYLKTGDDISEFVNKTIDEKTDEEAAYNSSNPVASGFVFDNLVKDYDKINNLIDYDYAIKEDGTFGSSSSTKHQIIACKVGDNVILSSTDTSIRYAFATSDSYGANAPIPLVGGTSVQLVPQGNTVYLSIPEGCNYLLLQGYTNNQNNGWIKTNNINVINPYFDYRGIRANSGAFISNNYNREIYSSLRYIALSYNSSFDMMVSDNRYYRVFYWDKDFNYLGASSSLESITANTWTKVNTPYPSAKYVKINLQVNSTLVQDGSADSTTLVQLRGCFDEKYEVFNIRPNTLNGYMNLFVSVNVTNPTATDEETTILQDQATYLEDYGMLWLPQSYNNIGEPTRLIIYCHGAGVQYTYNTNPNTDTKVVKNIDPRYWLAEGYAILDIDGNPFDNTNDHNQTPQSQDSYLAAYKWVINAFNIKRDGVFMGGRSMGASCALNLSRRDCPIPVIASCYNVPGGLTLSASTTSVAKKQFVTTHCGFEVPEDYTWQIGGIQTTDRQLFIDNWDKWVMNNPTLAIITNLPDAADVMDNYDYDLFGNFCDTNRLKASVNCPVKFFACLQDATCPPSKTSQVLYRLFQRGGQRVEIRIYDCSVKYSSPSTEAHHYDTQDENLKINYTSKYGESLSNISIVYIEMLEFWRRYEQGN